MKRALTVCLVLWVVLLIGSGFAHAQSDPVVAKVNGEDILRSDLDLLMNTFVLPQFQAQNQGIPMSEEQQQQIRQNLLNNQLIPQRLILQVAAKLNIAIDEELLNQRFEAATGQFPNVDPEQLKQFVKNDLIIQKAIEQEVTSKVIVSDEEAQKVYDENLERFNEPEQIRASHILVAVQSETTQEEKEAARQKIEAIATQLQDGKDFAELAMEQSDCPSGERGGDLGLFPRGVMVKPFEDAAFALNEDEVSGIVETDFGYHLIKLTEKKAQRQVPFEEVKDRLKQSLVQQKTNSEVSAWLDNLKSTATIEIM